MFVTQNNMKILLLSSKYQKKFRRIGCYYYSIDFKYGELFLNILLKFYSIFKHIHFY